MHFLCNFFSFVREKTATNFMDLATTLENLGARCRLEEKVHFGPCQANRLSIFMAV